MVKIKENLGIGRFEVNIKKGLEPRFCDTHIVFAGANTGLLAKETAEFGVIQTVIREIKRRSNDDHHASR